MINLPLNEKEAEILVILLGKLPTEARAYPLWDKLNKLIEENKGKQ